MNITDKYIESLYQLSQNNLTNSDIRQAKKCVLDYLACTYLGAKEQAERIDAYIETFGKQNDGAKVLGFHKKVSVTHAAFLNGINSHVCELDDGHRFGMLHLAGPVISATLSMSQVKEVNGYDFLRGVVIGYEAAIRLAKIIQPQHKLNGFHATGTCGTIGAALGIASMLNYTKSEWKNVLSAAAASATGLLEVIDDGSELKPYNVGRAALEGTMAAITGKIGYLGPNDILGGKRGFFSTIHYDIDNNKIDEVLDSSEWLIHSIYLKPYAACRHCHAAIEAAYLVFKNNNIHLDEIEKIQIQTYGLAVYGHDHKNIPSVSSAKMSIPFSVATVLYNGNAGYRAFSNDLIHNDIILKLISKIEVIEDKELSKLVPNKRAAKATIITKENTFTEQVDYPKGEPESPITYDEVKEKLRDFMEVYGADHAYIDEILDCMESLECNFEKLLSCLI